MASGVSAVHGSRSATAATAPAMAPRTAVVADESPDGSAVDFFRVDRDAAARAAVFDFSVERFAPAFVAGRFFAAFAPARLDVVARVTGARLAPDRLAEGRFALDCLAVFRPFADGRFAAERPLVACFLDARFATPASSECQPGPSCPPIV